MGKKRKLLHPPHPAQESLLSCLEITYGYEFAVSFRALTVYLHMDTFTVTLRREGAGNTPSGLFWTLGLGELSLSCRVGICGQQSFIYWVSISSCLRCFQYLTITNAAVSVPPHIFLTCKYFV